MRLTSNECPAFVPGPCIPVPWHQNGHPGAARLRAGRGCVHQFADPRLEPVVRHIGRKRCRQDGNDQIHIAVPVLGDQRREHLGGAANFRGEYHPRSFR